MSEDNSTVPADATLNSPHIELSELSDEVRPLAKRYAEQEKGSLMEKARHSLTAFAKDPVEGLRLMDELDPRVSEKVIKDLGMNSRDELVNSFKKKDWLSEEDVLKLFERKTQENNTGTAKANIETKLSQLPESIRDIAKAEFSDLTDGRSLSPEKLELMANKAIDLARVQSGTFEKSAKLNFGSQNMGGINAEPVKKSENPLLAGTTDPFWDNLTK